MRVKSCMASDGSGHLIKLSDEYGCVLRPKMISRFLKARAPNEKATVITYAFFHAFKFPDALSVHIKCKVEICRHGCLDHCQQTGNVHERKDTIIDAKPEDTNELTDGNDLTAPGDDGGDMSIPANDHDMYYDDMLHNREQMPAGLNVGPGNAALLKQVRSEPQLSQQKLHQHVPQVHEEIEDIPNNHPTQEMLKTSVDDLFPHGPRHLEAKDRMGLPAVAGPRSLNLDNDEAHLTYTGNGEHGKPKRQRRSIVVTDRKVRSTDVGVSGVFDVISEADLAFSPDSRQEAVTVFQGKITEEIVYGICMPVPGFSILFIVVTSAAIISALVAGTLLYRYQLQKEVFANQKNADNVNQISSNTIASWMTMRLFRIRQHQQESSENVTTTPNTQPQ